MITLFLRLIRMIRQYAIVRNSASVAADAVDGVCRAYLEGQIQGEETFTDRMMGAIAERFRALRIKGVKWTALTLTAHQRNAQETEFGADFMGVLDIGLPDFEVRKGFLAQAKLLESNDYFFEDDFQRLREQCEKLLRHTSDAFGFLYSKAGVVVVPALSVLGLRTRANPHVLYKRSAKRFFEEHFESFIGDRRIYRADRDNLEKLRTDVAAQRLLFLRAEPA